MADSRTISDADLANAQKLLDDRLTKFVATAIRIRDERDQAIYVLDTLIENMRQHRLPVTEGNAEAGVFATAIAHWLDYARDQRSRLP